MPRYPRFKRGDLVRFKVGGKVDWEVAAIRPHQRFSNLQEITLKSGMTDRIATTTNEHVIHRDEALR